MERRTLLTAIGAGALSLAGCTTGEETPDAADGSTTDRRATDREATDPVATGEETTEPESPGTSDGDPARTDTGLPEACPTSQDLGVEWPEDLDETMVRSFVETYEHAYFRDVVVGYEPESRLDSYGLSGRVTEGPTREGDGWVVAYSGSGGVYRPSLLLSATETGAPADVDMVPASDVENERVDAVLREAAETGDAEDNLRSSGVDRDAVVDRLASLSDDFDRLSEPGDSDSLYADVDGATVELTVTATRFHGDYWWDVEYYVDQRVVRRTREDDTDPRAGELLECRRLD